MLTVDYRRLDDVLEVGPTAPMDDAEVAAMLTDAQERGLVPTPPTALLALLEELRACPEGIATRVRADLLIADVFDALARPAATA